MVSEKGVSLLTCRYTSIGTKKNTFKNKLLLMENGEYNHASMLKEWDQERVRA